MDLGSLLVRAPGAETLTPILGYEYLFGSHAHHPTVMHIDQTAPKIPYQRFLSPKVVGYVECRGHGRTKLRSAFQRRWRALARLPILRV